MPDPGDAIAQARRSLWHGPEQESLLAERSEAGSSLADNKLQSALVWQGYTPLLCKSNDFNAYGVFGRDKRWTTAQIADCLTKLP